MRSLKVLGLVFVAALALSAMIASGASAATVVGGPIVHGEDGEGIAALTGAVGVECEEDTYEGTGVGATISLEPSSEGCEAAGAPATVTWNGCSFVWVLGPNIGHTAAASTSIVCPPNQQVVIHLYTSPAHTLSFCTIEIPPQAGLLGATVHYETNTRLRITGSVGGVRNYIQGHCATTASGGALETLNPGNAIFDFDITLESEAGLELE